MSKVTDSKPYLIDGNTAFDAGADGNSPADTLPRNQVAAAVNATMRGGPARPRPPFVKIPLTFNNNSSLQSAFQSALFQHAAFYDGNGVPSLLSSHGGRQFKIDIGKWIVSEITPATGRNSSRLTMGWSVQAENYWIFQDNQSAPIIFDGATSRRSDPHNWEVPTGNVMCYAMGRLIVALPDRKSYRAGNLVFENTGTTADLLRFDDNNYLNEGGDFVARVFGAPSIGGEIKAMKAIAMEDTQLGQGPILIHQPNCIFTVNLPFDRTAWKDTSNPLQTVTPIKGGLGQNSTILQNGDTWYRALDGIRSYIQARKDFRGPGNTPMSNEMNHILDLDTTPLLEYGSSAIFDNRLLMTVSPVQSAMGVWHRGLVVMDFNLVSSLRGKEPPCWEGVWTKLRVLQIVSATVNQEERCFLYVLNDSSQIELWEIDLVASKDNGTDDINWSLDLPSYNFRDSDQFKALEAGRMVVQEISGTLAYTARYRSDQNPLWISWDSGSICAKNQTCNPATCAGPQSLQPQQRSTIKFHRPEDDMDTVNGRKFRTGYQFQVRLEFTGQGALRQFRAYAADHPEDINALRNPNEDCSAAVTGCPPTPFGDITPPSVPSVFWNTQQSFTANCPAGTTGSPVTATVPANTYSSMVSQADADSQALAAATNQANSQLSCTPPIIQGQLSGLQWVMPCTNSSQPCSCSNPADQTVVLNGDPSHTYQVTLRFRGVVELNPYTGGSVSTYSPLFYEDATGPFTPGNTYSLEVSDPPHTYYLNNNYNSSAFCVAIDYQVTVPMKGGATVTIKASAGDGLEVANASNLLANNTPPLSNNIQGASGTTPYSGQFIEMSVISVTY